MSELTNIAALNYLLEYDPAVGAAMEDELKRQRRNLELIASENIVTPAVMWRRSPVSAHASCSVLSTPTFSLTRALRLTQRFILQCSSRAIP